MIFGIYRHQVVLCKGDPNVTFYPISQVSDPVPRGLSCYCFAAIKQRLYNVISKLNKCKRMIQSQLAKVHQLTDTVVLCFC